MDVKKDIEGKDADTAVDAGRRPPQLSTNNFMDKWIQNLQSLNVRNSHLMSQK